MLLFHLALKMKNLFIIIVLIQSVSNHVIVRNIVALGSTGVGKSSLLNMFAGEQHAFKVGESVKSETQLTEHKVFNALGDETRFKIRLVDTQGLSDGAGDQKDMEHIKNIVKSIRDLEHIDLFILCLDSTNPRLADYVKSTIDLFIKIFPDFLDHTVLAFNKWTSPDIHKRNNLKFEYQEKFEILYQKEDLNCYFFDSYFNLKMLRDNDNGTQTVRDLHPDIKKRTMEQIESFLKYVVVKNTRCDVRRIKPHDTKWTASEKEKIEIIREAREQKKEIEAELHNDWVVNLAIGITSAVVGGGITYGFGTYLWPLLPFI
jgi:predicted GTPase